MSDALRKAYRHAVLKLHPDHNPDPAAHREFLRLTEEYQEALRRLPPPPRRAAKPLPPDELVRLAWADWRRWLARATEAQLDEKVKGLPRRVWAAAALGCPPATEDLRARLAQEPPAPTELVALESTLAVLNLTTRRSGNKMNAGS